MTFPRVLIVIIANKGRWMELLAEFMPGTQNGMSKPRVNLTKLLDKRPHLPLPFLPPQPGLAPLKDW